MSNYLHTIRKYLYGIVANSRSMRECVCIYVRVHVNVCVTYECACLCVHMCVCVFEEMILLNSTAMDHSCIYII